MLIKFAIVIINLIQKQVAVVKKILLILYSLAILCFTGVNPLMAEIETPEYTIITTEGNIEIRNYMPIILAEVSTEGERIDAANKAFYILFDYIKGNNVSNQKITMTAPVNQEGEKITMTSPVNQSGENNKWKVSFTIPSKFTLETIPKPKDSRIRIYATGREKRIVIMFSGRWTDSNFNENKIKLDNYIHENQLKVKGNTVYAYYNAPFSLPFFRRNEIMYVMID